MPPADWRDAAAPHARSGTCTATHLLAPCPLYPLHRGTTPAAVQLECILTTGLPAQGGERTLLSGARRGSVGAEGGDQGGEPSSQVLHRRPCESATTRSRWSLPRSSMQVAAAGGRCGAHLSRGRRQQVERLPGNWSHWSKKGFDQYHSFPSKEKVPITAHQVSSTPERWQECMSSPRGWRTAWTRPYARYA